MKVLKKTALLTVATALLMPILVGQVSAEQAKQNAKQDVTGNAADNKVFVRIPSLLPPPKIDAKAWVLMEVKSGWVIAGKNAEMQLPPASITKLMTNYIVFESLSRGEVKLSDSVPISEKAWRVEGSRMFADVNSKVELEHLLKSTIIQSGNDAAISLAEHLAGSEVAFALRMNKAAKKLGLSRSHFVNSTGLPADNHRMTAHDIARLSAAIIEKFPNYYTWYSQKDYTHNKITQHNRNKLLWKNNGVDGLKTGHTQAAGFCLVVSALRKDERWIAVVLGAESVRAREEAVMKLLDYGFSNYRSVQWLDQQGGVIAVPAYKGLDDQVRLQPAEQVYGVVPQGREKEIQIDYKHNPYYIAPIKIDQPMAMASISLDNKVLHEVPLVAMSSIEEAGFWKRFVDGLRLRWIEK